MCPEYRLSVLSVDVDQIKLEKDNLKLNKEAARNQKKKTYWW